MHRTIKSVTAKVLQRRVEAGEWEKMSDVGRAGFVDVRDCRTDRRFVVEIVREQRKFY